MNGAALQILAPEPASSTCPEAPAAQPDAVFTASQQIEIGDLIARAAGLMCMGAEQYQAGQATCPTSLQVGELIAQLYFLQQSAPEVFATVVVREGRRTLRAALGRTDAAKHGDMDTAALDEVLGWPLNVLARVTESERAFVAAMAN